MIRNLIIIASFLLILVGTSTAQTSASQAGIGVQGIARDANNTALASQTISFTFTIYYLDASSLEVLIFEETLNLDTDAFGVFSHVIDPTAVSNPKFANYVAHLRIKKGTDIVSNEKLRHVPYAISANNGVPTGSIMPYIGTTAPYGWALCDGTALPITATELIALVGVNAPNLQGMFLRGTGTSPVNSQAGPALQATQGDEFKSHLHGVGTIAATAGSHLHTTKLGMDWTDQNGDDGSDKRFGTDSSDGWAYPPTNSGGGDHSHAMSGNTTFIGSAETRPVNYGVNYIIKL